MNKSFGCALVAILILGLGSPASAERFSIPLVDATGEVRGQAMVINNPRGPDEFMIRLQGLPTSTRYTVFLTNSPTLGALPAHFVGEFTSAGLALGANGANGVFRASTEVINVFASHNAQLENDQGIADVPAAGALALGANTISLNWIRIYLAEGNLSVFGTSENDVGGGLAFTSATPIPESGPVVAYLGGGSQREIDVGFGTSKDASMSTGDIVEYRLDFGLDGGPMSRTLKRNRASFGGSIAPFGCAGQRIRYRLTVTDSSGRSDSFEQIETIVQGPQAGLPTTCLR